MGTARLDKIICDSGKATRSEARILIKSGRVCVNGVPELKADSRFESELSVITLDGKPINSSKFRYFVMNKPDGVLSATEDDEQKTVIDLLPEDLRRLGLFPVGRLDKDTTGLLILTNDGEFAHMLTSPRHHIIKRYEVVVDGELCFDDSAAFEQGITLRDGTICMPAKLEIDPNDASHCFVELKEGKYHQVKRMLASRGKPVISLRRIAVGGLKLDSSLCEGSFREISAEEKAGIIVE